MPAAVYVPFVNQAMRNYAVLHIPISEIRIFQTKQRCPLLICLEVFRPDELSAFLGKQKIKINNKELEICSDADTRASQPNYIKKSQKTFIADVEKAHVKDYSINSNN